LVHGIMDVVDNSESLVFLHGRREPDADGNLTRQVPLLLRQYLRISNPGARRAFTKVLLSEHRYATRLFRFTRSRAQCRCRFCKTEVESPEHLWLICGHSRPIAEARRRF
ncbi:hypothetical protein DFP72DRAFT_746085, partial [Ephemerocybe angulata]